MPKTSPAPKAKLKLWLIIGTDSRLVSWRAIPVTTPIVPRVISKEETCKRSIKKPLIKPTSKPMDNAPMIANGIPTYCSNNAPTKADNATTEPIDKSIWPTAKANVSPTAITVIGAVWRTIFIKLVAVKNAVSCRKMANNTSTTKKI